MAAENDRPTREAKAEPCVPERRFLAGAVEAVRPEQRADQPADEQPHLRGYAAVFNQETDLGWFREVILPGAFSRAIIEDDVRALWNHDTGVVLGRVKAGTLSLAEDTHGLAVDITPPASREDVVESVRRGDVTGMSFAFRALREEWDYTDEVSPLRRVAEVELWEVSPATFPAYQGTSLAARSIEDVYREQELAREQAQTPEQKPGSDVAPGGQEPEPPDAAELLRLRLRAMKAAV